MKLRTNFVRRSTYYTPVIGGIVWVTSILLVLVSLVLVIDYQQMDNELESILEQNHKLLNKRDRLNSQANQNLPANEALKKLARDIAILNSVSGIKSKSVNVLLARLERALPVNTYLKNLGLFPVKGEILLTAVSSRTDLLTGFLRKLEKDKYFERVMLVRQTKNDQSDKTVEFDIRIVVS